MRLASVTVGLVCATLLSCEAAKPNNTYTIATGQNLSLWIDQGRLIAWGALPSGEGDLGFTPTPKVVDSSEGWATISVGGYNVCGTQIDGTAWCWGSFRSKNITPAEVRAWTLMSDDTDWAAVKPSLGFLCGLKTDGTLWCWGENTFGTLGDGTTTAHATPTQVGSGTWKDFALGFDHACGLKTDGTLWCWGHSDWGQVGDGSLTTRPSPVQIGGSDWRAVAIASAGETSCGLKTDGSLWCWGFSDHGNLGFFDSAGSERKHPSPLRMGGSATFDAISMGVATICGMRNGTPWCWGWISAQPPSPELLIYSNVNQQPIQLSTESDWEMVAAGYPHICVMKKDHTVWCSGSNVSGEVGDGTRTLRTSLVKVSDPE